MMSRALVAEALGTALLVATVIGSGIMADRLSGGIDALALLANAIATGAMLVVLITILGPLSGAHFNPAVSTVMAARGAMPWARLLPFAAAQLAGGIAGAALANAMFGLDLFQIATTERATTPALLAEIIATFTLIGTILGGLRFAPHAIPWLVGLFITAAYWFTSSTSFANPAVTIARAFSDSFAGIAPASVLPFIAAQIFGAALGAIIWGWLFATDQDGLQ
jgi:glycerol uptake facilitator-like aquaporin